MTPFSKKVIAAVLAGVATVIATLGASEAGIIDPKIASTLLAIINAILLAGTPLKTKN